MTESQHGRQKENVAQWVVMYLRLKLRHIAAQPGLIRTPIGLNSWSLGGVPIESLWKYKQDKESIWYLTPISILPVPYQSQWPQGQWLWRLSENASGLGHLRYWRGYAEMAGFRAELSSYRYSSPKTSLVSAWKKYFLLFKQLQPALEKH